jgi:predicted transglutaminase-like cysteine proteinase
MHLLLTFLLPRIQHCLPHRLAPALLMGSLLGSGMAWGGLTDFSPGLLAWAQQKWGADAPKRLQVWQRVVADSRASAGKADAQAVLGRTNAFFNQVPYVNDIKHWGVEDYWATPTEMLGSFGGDCEDYSVGKYLTLKDLGVPIERLRITYVRALRLNESHMVLAYYPQPDADPLILDNLVPDIKPASQRTDLEPVYSFNDDDLWLPTGQTRKGGSSQVRLWKDMLEKLAREQRL